MSLITPEEAEALKRIEDMKDISPDEFLFRLEMLLIELGLMQPWQCVYNPCYVYRIT